MNNDPLCWHGEIRVPIASSIKQLTSVHAEESKSPLTFAQIS